MEFIERLRMARALFVFLSMLCLPLVTQARTLVVSPLSTSSSDKAQAAESYPSLAAAVARLQPGDTLLIAGGEYRESIEIPKQNWSVDHPTTIKPISGARVVIKGSDLVTGWIAKGEGKYGVTWVGKPEPEQVFVDGKPLKQIGGTIFNGYPERPSRDLKGVRKQDGGIWLGRIDGDQNYRGANWFYFDRARQALIIAPDKALTSTTKVEVSTRPRLLNGDQVEGLSVEDIEFEHSNTSADRRGGAIRLIGKGNALKNLKVRYMDAVGIHIGGDDNVVEGCEVSYSGQLGMAVRGYRNKIRNNKVLYSNTRGFNKNWEAGGMKFIGDGGAHETEVTGNLVAFNEGDGIWIDGVPLAMVSSDNLISNNRIFYNSGFGVHCEASVKVLVANNMIVASGQRGIYLLQTSDSTVANNVVIGNGLQGVVVMDAKRETPGRDLTPRNNFIGGNLVAWNKGPQLILPPSLDGNVADANVYVATVTPVYSLGWPKIFNGGYDALSAWSARTGGDSSSRESRAAMPASLQSSINAHDLNIPVMDVLGMYDPNRSASQTVKSKLMERMGTHFNTRTGTQ